MLKRIYKEIDDFTLNIKTIENHKQLINYMNNSFYSSMKLLISISSTFSIFWKVVFPFIVSSIILLVLLSIEPIRNELKGLLNINYVLGIFLYLILITLGYVFYAKKYFNSSMDKIKSSLEEDKN